MKVWLKSVGITLILSTMVGFVVKAIDLWLDYCLSRHASTYFFMAPFVLVGFTSVAYLIHAGLALKSNEK